MLHLPSLALSHLLLSNTAMIIFRDTAVVLRVPEGDVGVATDAEGALVGTNVPTLVVKLMIWTLHVVVADDLTLVTGGVGGTVLGALVITCL